MPAKKRGMADLLAEQRALISQEAEQAEQQAATVPDGAQPVLTVVPEVPPSPAVPADITGAAIPEPHSPTGHGELSARERDYLATCEAAIDNLRLAFAAAGKALQVIRDARLYRATHDTFEDYASQCWDLSRAQAYRLIDAWRLAVRLSPIGDKLNERQVRELLALAETHGQDAAVTVYQAVTETDGVRVSGAILKDVVAILPADYFDPAEAVAQIRAYLAGEKQEAPPADPVQALTAQSDKLVRGLHRFAASATIKAARNADPDAVRQAVAELRATLDEIEREIT
jgi:hypothetical protein